MWGLTDGMNKAVGKRGNGESFWFEALKALAVKEPERGSRCHATTHYQWGSGPWDWKELKEAVSVCV